MICDYLERKRNGGVGRRGKGETEMIEKGRKRWEFRRNKEKRVMNGKKETGEEHWNEQNGKEWEVRERKVGEMHTLNAC